MSNENPNPADTGDTGYIKAEITRLTQAKLREESSSRAIRRYSVCVTIAYLLTIGYLLFRYLTH